MIISGGARCNWRFFARHLMKPDDNERVNVAEIRGLAAEDVREAFREMDFVAGGTRCKNFFYHANINPKAHEHLTSEQWEQAVDTLERNLRLDGHSRFVVEHEKEGRTHRHVVWSRVDPDTMTVVSDSFTARDHERTSRELEEAFGLEPVRSVLIKDRDAPRPERGPKNWEKFRGNDSGLDPHQLKAEITGLWNAADSGKAFKAALEERGYILCRGDRRDFCIVDPAGDEHSLARRIKGARAPDIRARMSDIDQGELPTVAEGRALAMETEETAGGVQLYHEPDTQPQARDGEPHRHAGKHAGGRLDEYAADLAQAFGEEERALPWTDAECTMAPYPQTGQGRDAGDQLDEYAAPLEAAIAERGEIDMADGMTFWERTVSVFSQARERVSEWARESWQSLVETWREFRTPENDGPDLGR